jgi:hypothetical protein
MTNKEILANAIKKAVDNGWNSGGHDTSVVFNDDDYNGYTIHVMTWQAGSLKSFIYHSNEEVIFNHDFAKALWSKGLNVAGCYEHNMDEGVTSFILPGWKYLLQQMVISDDPIKYLGEHI